KSLDLIPGGVADGLSERVKNWQAELGKMADKNINASYERVEHTTSTTTQNLRAKKSMTDAEAQQLILDINTGKNTGNELLKQAEEYQRRAQEIRDENEKLAKDREAERGKQSEGTQGKNSLTNTQTAATLAATQAKLSADLNKMQIDQTIERIQTQQQLDQRALDDRAKAEGLTANEIADERLAIDLKANQEISDQRKASIGEDLKVLEAQLSAQKKVLGQSTIDSERGTALGAIADLEAQITVKRQEQVNLTGQLANQEALLKGERASSLADAKAQIKALKEQLDVDLLRIRGNDYQADLKEIEREFADTKRVLESLGEDSTAAKELVDARKAKAELTEIERQYDRLKEKLSKNQITQADFKAQSGKLIERGEEAAGNTGNEEDLDRVNKMTEDAKSSVLSLDQLTGALGESMSSNFESAFSGWISGSKSASDAMSEMATSVLADISKIIAKMLIQLAIQQMLSAFGYGGASGGGMSSALSGLSASVNHDGGVIGSGGGRSRTINPLMFTTPLYYHTGGIAGLAADEVPAVLQKGEEVLTKNDPRHRNNIGKGQDQSAAPEQKVTIVNQIDSESIASSMDSPAGERVIMNLLRANKGEIKSW
ncbi:hypothetical protein, partial [Pseudomonas asplenii]|uniref:hypothetical protein n=1 Tax=Pseudomonas asplenii TaxID=53407 RepID=UPI00037BCDAB